MNEDEFRQLIGEIDPEGNISEEKIQEVLDAMRENEKNPLKDGDTRKFIDDEGKEQTITYHTLDWRERAAQAAKNISRGLDA